MGTKNQLVLVLVCWQVGLVIAIIKFSFHELWKDEWQAWMIAINTGSLSELWEVCHLEGHPILWYLYLKGGGWISLNLGLDPGTSLKLLHLLLVIFANYLICFRICSSTVLKALLIFAFFGSYEYGVISRGYILVYLLVLLIVEAIQNHRSPVTIGIYLFSSLPNRGIWANDSRGYRYLPFHCSSGKLVRSHSQLMGCNPGVRCGNNIVFYFLFFRGPRLPQKPLPILLRQVILTQFYTAFRVYSPPLCSL